MSPARTPAPDFLSRHLRFAALAAFAWATATIADAEVTFTDLGNIAGGSAPEPAALSADGSTVVGHVVVSGLGDRGFRWTEATGMQDLGTLPGAPAFPTVFARAVSPDGSVVVGSSTDSTGLTRAYRWSLAAGMQSFGEIFPGGERSAATGLSADGGVVVGNISMFANGTPRAVRWNAGGAVQILGSDVDSYNSRANGVSADGTTIVGVRNGGHPFVMTSGGVRILGTFNRNQESSATAVNADGSVVAGWSGGRAYRFTLPGGMQDLGSLPDGNGASAAAVNADGSAVVGQASEGTGFVAFLWTPALGMVDLNDYLAGLGAEVSNLILTGADAISADGSVIAGRGMSVTTGQPGAWIMRGLPLGGACAPATIKVEPRNGAACFDGAAVFTVTTGGSLPLSAQWQRETEPGSNVFVALEDGPTTSWDGDVAGAGGIVSGSDTHELTIAADGAGGRNLTEAHAIRYRHVVSNGCGEDTSRIVQLVFGPDTDLDGLGDPCDPDDDEDGVVDDQDPCPLLASEPPGDIDGDGAGDACDGCRLIWDRSQDDADGDGITDACDMPWGDLAPRNALDGRLSTADVVMMQRAIRGKSAMETAELSRGDIAPASASGNPPVLTPLATAPRYIDAADVALALDVLLGRASLADPS